DDLGSRSAKASRYAANPARSGGRGEEDDDDGPARAPIFGNGKPAAAAKPPKVTMPPLPLADPEPTAKAPAERRRGDYQLPPLALLDAPKTERKIDERELMDGARLLE